MRLSVSGIMLAALLSFILLGAVAGTAGEVDEEQIVKAAGYASVDEAAQGSSFQIALVAQIAHGWHINARQPTDEFLVPTDVVLEASPGILLGRTAYPAAAERTFAFSGKPLAVYEGRIVVSATASVSETAELGQGMIRGILTYQACNDETCLPPTEIPFEIPVEIVAGGTSARAMRPEVFDDIATVDRETRPRGGRVAGLIRDRGLLAGFLMLFVWGLGLNLTPCVYPIIPLTVGYFGAQSGGRLATRFGLGIAYFIGIALMYSTLGVVAAATGGLFGAALQSPAVLAVVAAILVALSLSMFGLWEIRLPAFLMRAGGGARQGAVGAFVMGLTVGIVAAPCVGAVVAALLIYVAETGDLFLGFWLFFALSCGLGLPFLVLAVFSSSISSLPKSGEWMAWIRRLFGVLLIGMAVYFLRTLIPAGISHYVLPVVAAAGAIYLGFIDRTRSTSRAFSWVKLVVGVIGIGILVWLLMAKKELPAVKWNPYTTQAYEEALASGKPVIIDFSAEWCIPCHEMERYTFTDPRVLQRAPAFETFVVDLTRSVSPEERALKEELKVIGVPTLVFIAPPGREVTELRAEGFIDPDQFLERMDDLVKR